MFGHKKREAAPAPGSGSYAAEAVCRAYLDDLLVPLNLPEETRRDIAEEYMRHLLDAADGLREAEPELSPAEAAERAVRRFGDAERLRAEIRRSYPTRLQYWLYREMPVWAICVVAGMAGPGLLMGIRFQPGFVAMIAMMLAGAAALHAFVRAAAVRIPVRIAAPAMYGLYAAFAAAYGFPAVWAAEAWFPPGNWIQSLGLYTTPALHALWLPAAVAAAIRSARGGGFAPADCLREAGAASARYWLLAAAPMMLAPVLGSGEAEVYCANLFPLYAVLREALPNPMPLRRRTLRRTA